MSKYLKNDDRKFYIYKMYDENNELLYIGKTIQFTVRMNQHFSIESMIKDNWKTKVCKIVYFELDTKVDMDMVELYLIATERPRYNRESTDTTLPKIKIEFNKKNEKVIYVKGFKKESVFYITDKEKENISNRLFLYDGKMNEYNKKEFNISKSWLRKNVDSTKRLKANILTYKSMKNELNNDLIISDDIKTYFKCNSNYFGAINDISVFKDCKSLILIPSENDKNSVFDVFKIIKYITLTIKNDLYLYIPSKKIRYYLKLWLNEEDIIEEIKVKDNLTIEKEYLDSIENIPLNKEKRSELVNRINLRDERNRFQKSYSKINEYLQEHHNMYIESKVIRAEGQRVRVWILKNK